MAQNTVPGMGLPIHQVQTITLQATSALICGSIGRGVQIKEGYNPQQWLPGVACVLHYVMGTWLHLPILPMSTRAGVAPTEAI